MHRARREGAACRRGVCLAILFLLLAHQALAMRDHRDAGDAAFATATAPTATAPEAADGPTDRPDMVGGLRASDPPALLLGACPAHQGIIPVPLPGNEPVFVVAYVDAPDHASRRVDTPRARDGDQRRRRALLQVFRN